MMAASNGNAQWATGAMSRRSNGADSVQGTRRGDPQPERNPTLARIVQRFDVYAKVDDDLQVRTEAGAAVTIGFWLLMVVLVVGEVQAYLRVQPAIERVVVDSTMGQRVRINADITFHAVPCLDVHVDAMDVAGENQIDIDHDMTKQRLRPDGSPIAEPFTEIPGEIDESLQVASDYCGSCYGAKGEPSANGRCCNTCKEVADAYTAMGWALHEIRRTAEQCVRDYHLEIPIVEGEGCRLAGFMTVNKVSGNFHVAAGEGVMRDGRHIHLYNMDDAEKFNSSHTINRLSFGDPYPGMRPNPLDGTSRIIDEDKGTGLFQYFIKLVPTVHSLGPEAEWGAQLTSQFAYTYKFRSLTGATEYHTDHTGDVPHHHAAHAEEHDQPKTAAKPMLLPGIFFVYDVSPFMVEVAAASVIPFSHLLIRLCAVAGGAFAVSGIVDSAVFHVSKRLRRHSLLGR